MPHGTQVPVLAPTAAPLGAQRNLQGRVGHLGLIPTRGGWRERRQGLFSTPPGSLVGRELLWESVPSRASPSRFFPVNLPSNPASCPRICPGAAGTTTVNAECMGNTCLR